MLIRFFSSLRLTLTLLLGLALISIYGTVWPAREGGLAVFRYEVFYQSLGFRLLLGLLALNLGVCTLRTIGRNLRDRAAAFDTLHSERVYIASRRFVLPRRASFGRLAETLAAQRYRVTERDGALLGERGRPGRWGSTLVHLSVLLIMAGSFSSNLGFVGTLNLYVGDSSRQFFDWNRQANVPLGFTLRLDHFEPVYYPIAVKFVVIDPATRQRLATYTAREGETVALPAPGMTATVLKFIPEGEQLLLGIARNGVKLGEYRALSGHQEFPNRVDPGGIIKPVVFRTPVVRQFHSEVTLLDEGRLLTRGVIEVNQPLVYDGVSIYLTGYNRDKFGSWSTAFQISKDPGKPAVWVGCILFLCGLLTVFLVPCRTVGVKRAGGEILFVALSGFRGESGRIAFDRLEETLSQSGRSS